MKKLPVTAAFVHAFQSAFGNMSFAFSISWPWMLIMLPIHAVAVLYLTSLGLTHTPSSIDPSVSGKIMAVNLPVGIASLFANASIAVNWHRYILLDEMPRGFEKLRMDSTVFKYAGNLILIALRVGALAFIPISVLIATAAFVKSAVVIVGVPLFVWLVIVATRLTVKLPAIALGQSDFRMRDALYVTGGNNWRFCGLLLLTTLLGLAVGLISFLFAKLINVFTNDVTTFSLLAVQFMINWVMTIFTLTTATTLYGYFVEDRPL